MARQPFFNGRPVRRVAMLLWGAGAVLFLGNLMLYWNHLADSQDMRQRLAATEERIRSAQTRAGELEERLAGFDLAWQNEQVSFLNARIAERTFSWSGLFDRLTEVLPRDVRLYNLSPRLVAASAVEPAAGRPGAALAGEEVVLGLRGAARDGEDLLELVDNLFAHGSFEDPNLSSEARQADRLLEFNLSVTYLPGPSPVGPAGPSAGPAEIIELQEAPHRMAAGSPGEPQPPAGAGSPGTPRSPVAPGPEAAGDDVAVAPPRAPAGEDAEAIAAAPPAAWSPAATPTGPEAGSPGRSAAPERRAARWQGSVITGGSSSAPQPLLPQSLEPSASATLELERR
jgi:hypothetical protein